MPGQRAGPGGEGWKSWGPRFKRWPDSAERSADGKGYNQAVSSRLKALGLRCRQCRSGIPLHCLEEGSGKKPLTRLSAIWWSPFRRRLGAADSFDSTNLVPGISAFGGIVFPAPISEKVWIKWFSTGTFGPLLEFIPPRRRSIIYGRDPVICHHGVHGVLDQREFSRIGLHIARSEESRVSRDGHRRQNGEDSDHDQQLNQGKTPLSSSVVSCQRSHKCIFPAEYFRLRV